MRNISAGRNLIACCVSLLVIAIAGCAVSEDAVQPADTRPAADVRNAATPPAMVAVTAAGSDEELRGMFVTTAYNADWPSRPGLTPDQLRSEIYAIVNRAQELKFNAIFLQVRAFGDRIYRNTGYPEIHWSQSVTYDEHFGDLNFDPLQEWIDRCHERGIQVYAWMNPFRTDWPVNFDGRDLPFYPSEDGKHLYLDHTDQDVQNYVMSVMEDLLKNYGRGAIDPKQLPKVKSAVFQRYIAKMEQIRKKKAAAPPSGRGDATSPGTTRVIRASATTQPDGDDGIDGIIVDHYFPDPGGDKQTMLPPPLMTPLQDSAVADASGGSTAATAAPRNIQPPEYCDKHDDSGYMKAKPTPRICWLIRSHYMTYPPERVGQVDANAFVEASFQMIEAHDCIFGVSPNAELKGKKRADPDLWLTRGWCHYFLPELNEKPSSFKTDLADWKKANANSNVPAESKPLVLPVISTSSLENIDPKKLKLTQAEVESEINETRTQKVGHVHFSARTLRTHEHGGPGVWKKGTFDDVFYSDDKIIPPAGTQRKLSDPTVAKQPDGKVSLGTEDSDRVERYKVWFGTLATWGKPFFVSKPEDWAKLDVGDHNRIKVQAFDHRNRRSDAKAFILHL